MADKKEKVGFFGSIKNFFKGIGKRFKDIKAEVIEWNEEKLVIKVKNSIRSKSFASSVFELSNCIT